MRFNIHLFCHKAISVGCLSLFFVLAAASVRGREQFSALHEVNPPAMPATDHLIAVVGATLIDGRGGPPIPDSIVVLRGNKILVVGPSSAVKVPTGAVRFDASRLTLLPGLVDSHFHIGENKKKMLGLPSLVLTHGVTTARDPGRHIEAYEPIIKSRDPATRMFLTGPHFDQEPPAWPLNARIIKSPEEARSAVRQYVQQGASGIKVYFRLPLESVRATCETAHDLGIPVTAHLELVDADQAILAGLDGIEHITSFGSALAEPEVSAQFQAEVRQDNAARKLGRYRLWATLDLAKSSRVQPLLDLLVQRGVVVSPTLGTFERRTGDKNATDLAHIRGFQNMLKFTGLCHQAGVTVVVGSHTWVPHAQYGWAFQREMELLVESGMTPMQTICAATLQNAHFLGCADRLGSIETGKLADLLLIEGDPLQDIRAMLNVRRVMLNGLWVENDHPIAPASGPRF